MAINVGKWKHIPQNMSVKTVCQHDYVIVEHGRDRNVEGRVIRFDAYTLFWIHGYIDKALIIANSRSEEQINMDVMSQINTGYSLIRSWELRVYLPSHLSMLVILSHISSPAIYLFLSDSQESVHGSVIGSPRTKRLSLKIRLASVHFHIPKSFLYQRIADQPRGQRGQHQNSGNIKHIESYFSEERSPNH